MCCVVILYTTSNRKISPLASVSQHQFQYKRGDCASTNNFLVHSHIRRLAKDSLPLENLMLSIFRCSCNEVVSPSNNLPSHLVTRKRKTTTPSKLIKTPFINHLTEKSQYLRRKHDYKFTPHRMTTYERNIYKYKCL